MTIREQSVDVSKTERRGGQTSFIPGDGRGGELKNAALLIFCFNRIVYLERTLASLANLAGLDALGSNQTAHAYVAQHYKWSLDRVFELARGHSHAIVLEDGAEVAWYADMELSPDFITFFKVTAVLLEADPTLWCVSSYNDHGLSTFGWAPYRLMRTSHFPGVGWMLRREL
ncbi:hypothetical protein WJX81_000062 [Elliptochloris bilobata]|uniref:Alpha-1,3-mannosyl-glycoprotein 2-beta-N-acetylglucosaminyltransferase n=1 Tax=Elliptochloris bilobata TaxID=381761 RepID=A0AAW1QME7_9CHLO